MPGASGRRGVSGTHRGGDVRGMRHARWLPGCRLARRVRCRGLLALAAAAGTAAVAAAAVPALAIAARLPVTVTGRSAARAGRSVIHRFQRHQHAAPVAVLARHRERLQQAGPDPLARHLHQAERGDLGHLMLGPVPREAFEQPPEHQVAVALQHHVDEVDDDDAAHVPHPELPDDLLGGLQVVAGDRLLQVAAVAGELARVHVDHGHRLGGIDY